MNEYKKGKIHINADVVFGIAAIIVAVFFLYYGRNLKGAASDGTPGPGYFPTGIAVIVIIVAVVLIIKGMLNGKPLFKLREIEKSSLNAIILTVAGFILFMVIWYLWHYVPATIVFMICCGLIYRQKPISAVIFALIFSGVIYLVFSELLLVSLRI